MLPIEHSTDDVEINITGEAPEEIWWRGRQWAVTKYGIEALDGTYPIPHERLLDKLEEWSWIRQVGEKTWVDPSDFTTAFMVALVLHGYVKDANPETIRKAHAKVVARKEEAASYR